MGLEEGLVEWNACVSCWILLLLTEPIMDHLSNGSMCYNFSLTVSDGHSYKLLGHIACTILKSVV